MKSSYKQLNFKRMTNLKSNLRKVATIIACLTVVTMFASCGGKNPDDDDGGLNAHEKKLIGLWRWENIFNPSTPREQYVFTDKGKFFFYYGSGMAGDVKTGDFKATSDKITFTNIEHTINGVKKDYPKTQIAEYKFEQSPIGTGGFQEYLNICSLAYDDLTELPYKWYGSFKKIE